MLGSHRALTRDERAVFGRGVEPAAAGGCACVPAAIVLGAADGDEALAEGGAKVLAARIELGRARGGWLGMRRVPSLDPFTTLCSPSMAAELLGAPKDTISPCTCGDDGVHSTTLCILLTSYS